MYGVRRGRVTVAVFHTGGSWAVLFSVGKWATRGKSTSARTIMRLGLNRVMRHADSDATQASSSDMVSSLDRICFGLRIETAVRTEQKVGKQARRGLPFPGRFLGKSAAVRSFLPRLPRNTAEHCWVECRALYLQ